jgi:uncharacterized protein YjdB
VSTSKAIPVESVTLDKTTATLKEGETVTLVATVLPANATNNTGVIWTTSDATIATVADGVVTAVKAGTATISANAGGKSGTCAVTVTEAVKKISDITAEGNYKVIGKIVAAFTSNFIINDGTGSIEYYYGKTTQTVVVGDYVKAVGAVKIYYGIFEFSGDSNTITKLTETPDITIASAIDLTKAIADGWAGITTNNTADAKLYKWMAGASKVNGYWALNLPGSSTLIEPSKIDTSVYPIVENKAFNVEGYFMGYETTNKYAVIVVTKLEATTVAPTTLEVTADTTNIAIKKTLQLSVSPTPIYASKDVTWKSSDEDDSTIDAANKVTVDSTGLVSAPAGAADAHEVTITATSSVEGCTVSGTITLTVVAKLVTVTAATSFISMGETTTLTPGTNVTGATPTFTYTTDTAGSAIVTIGTVGTDGKVVVTGKAAGTATITVAAEGFTETTIDIKVLADIATVNGYADKAAFETKGVVLDVIDSGNFIVADKIGDKVHIALAYKSSNGVAVGDYVDLEGSFAAAGTYFAELKPTTITKLLATDGFVTPTITAANIAASATATNADFFNGTNTAAKIVSVTNSEVTTKTSTSSGTTTTRVYFAIDGYSKGSVTVSDPSKVTAGFYNFVGFLYKASSGYCTVAVYNDTLTAATRPTAATKVTVTAENSATTITQGGTVQLTAAEEPYGLVDTVTWASNYAKVTVSPAGLVTAAADAVADTSVTITATSTATSTIKGTIVLKVVAAVAPTGIVSYDLANSAKDFGTTYAAFSTTINNVSFSGSLMNYSHQSTWTSFLLVMAKTCTEFDISGMFAFTKVNLVGVNWGTDSTSLSIEYWDSSTSAYVADAGATFAKSGTNDAISITTTSTFSTKKARIVKAGSARCGISTISLTYSA